MTAYAALLRVAFVVMASALTCWPLMAHSQQLPSHPSAPHEKLALFEGEWKVVPSDPAVAFKESCSWLPEGRRHMVCRSRWLSNGQPREGLSVFSYDPVAGDYTYHGFRAGGALVVQRGVVEGGVWRLGSDRGQGPARQRISITIEPTDDGFTFVEQVAVGEGPWSERTRVQYRRAKPGEA